MKRANFRERKQQRREEAVARQELRDKRSNEQQIALLKSKRGESKKEIARLI